MLRWYNGVMTSFPKGHIPWNKGKKDVYSKEILQKMREAKLLNPTRYWLGKKREGFWLNKKRLNIKGENNYAWKGNEVGYVGLHTWVRRELGKPKICEHCGINKNMQWANKSRKYKRELTDWLSLCAKCHKKYDKSI